MKEFDLTVKEAEIYLSKGIAISCKAVKNLGHYTDSRYLDKLFDDKRCYVSMQHIPRNYQNPVTKGIWSGDDTIKYYHDGAYQSGGYIVAPDYGGYYLLGIRSSNEQLIRKIEGDYRMQFYDLPYDGLVRHLPPSITVKGSKWFLEDFYQSLSKKNKDKLLNDQDFICNKKINKRVKWSEDRIVYVYGKYLERTDFVAP